MGVVVVVQALATGDPGEGAGVVGGVVVGQIDVTMTVIWVRAKAASTTTRV
jgi:hypothetical protein